MNPLRSFMAGLDRILETILGLVFVAIILITASQVVSRYVIGGSFAWAEEVSLLLWVWMIQLGAIKTIHMRIDLVEVTLPDAARRIVSVTFSVLMIGLLAFLGWGGYKMMLLTWGDAYATVPWLPVSLSYLPLVISAPLWSLRIVLDGASSEKPESLRL